MHTAAAPHLVSTRRRSQGLLRWAALQLGQFLWLLAQICGVGVILAIARRQFHWKAFSVGLLTAVVGVAVVGTAVFIEPERLGGARDGIFWAGVMLVLTLAGAFVGRVGRRVGFWESYLVVAAAAGLAFVHLAKGWHIVLGLGPSERQGYLELFGALPPGVRLLGEQWERLLGLGAVGGLLLAIFGGSLAFLFYSDEGRLDARFRFERIVGVRHLTSHRRGLISVTAVVAVVGVALGVAALVTVTAVMSGYQEDIQDKILSTNAHLVVQKYGVDFVEHADIAKTALDQRDVLAATPFTFNEAMMSSDGSGVGVLLKGIEPSTAGDVTGVADNLCERVSGAGRCVPFERPSAQQLVDALGARNGVPSIVVGIELFKRLKAPIGTAVTLTTPAGLVGVRNNAPKRMEFRIGGVFRSGMHEFDSRLVYLEMGASQRLMGMGRSVNGVEFRVSDPQRVEEIAGRVLRAVGRYPYRTLDWRELNSGIFTALKLQKIVFFLVLAFIIVVAAFNIASTLFMAVVEKSRDIGVLKSMGARDASIMKIFVLEGWLVGGVGTLLGLVTGLAVCAIIAELDISIAADVYMVEALTVRVRPFEILLTAGAALVISHLATLYPALKAARQRPVDAMRYE